MKEFAIKIDEGYGITKYSNVKAYIVAKSAQQARKIFANRYAGSSTLVMPYKATEIGVSDSDVPLINGKPCYESWL